MIHSPDWIQQTNLCLPSSYHTVIHMESFGPPTSLIPILQQTNDKKTRTSKFQLHNKNPQRIMKPHLLHSLPSPPHLLPPQQPPSLTPPLPFNLSRRSLAIAAPLLLPTFSSLADTTTAITPCTSTTSTDTKTAFIDVSVDGQPIGRITIGLYESSAPSGATRFAKLVSGTAGISYRRKEFVKIMPNYVQHAGVRSYGVDAELAARTGNNTAGAADSLVAEWEANAREKCVKNVAGSVGIVVRDPMKPPPKVKIVAKDGKLAVEEEEIGVDPNGTEFVIVTKDSLELDESVLVVGKVLEGMEVVQKISQVKTVLENTKSPYFM